MMTLWATIRAAAVGMLLSMAGMFLYSLIFARVLFVGFEPGRAVGYSLLKSETVDSPMFWVFVIGGFVLGIYLARKRLPDSPLEF